MVVSLIRDVFARGAGDGALRIGKGARLRAATLALIFAAACDTSIPSAPSVRSISTKPPEVQNAVSPTRPFTYDDALLAIADSVEKFAGFADDSTGTVLLIASSLQQGEAQRAAIARAVARSSHLHKLDVQSMRIRTVAYTFRQLKAWQTLLEDAGARIVMSDADENQNVVVLRVESASGRSLLNSFIAAAGIPPSAVKIEVAPAAKPATTLRDYWRPIREGFQIAFPFDHPSKGRVMGLCTLGLNTYLTNEPWVGRLFVTASHCSNAQGVEDGSTVGQPDSLPQSYVGTKYRDPAYFPCTGHLRCRYSDAALYTYNPALSGMDFKIPGVGFYWNPQLPEPPAPVLDGSSYTILEYYSDQLNGRRIAKIGRSTGYSTGVIYAKCANVTYTDGKFVEYTILCADYSSLPVWPGDSGALVFYWSPPGSAVTAAGIVFATEQLGNGDWRGWSSPISLVTAELGQFSLP